MTPRIALLGMAGEYEVGFSETPALLARVAENLLMSGCAVLDTGIVLHSGETAGLAVTALKREESDVLCVCVGTWSEDHHLLDLLDYCPMPVILWAFPGVETGSLCGVQQICCVLKELDRKCFYVYGRADDPACVKEVRTAAAAAALTNRLRGVRIGTIGGRVKGMTEIAYDELEIKDRTGVRIVNLDEDELSLAMKDIGDAEAAALWRDIKKRAGKVTSSGECGIESMKYYLGMKRLVAQYGLEGICIKCYPRFMGRICLGYSMLSEEGVVCGCEGDVGGTIAMKLMYELTGMPVHNTDLLHPDTDMNTILFSHCGSGGFSIASRREDIHLGPVRLAGGGVCALFPARAGRVTLLNLVGRKGTLRLSVLTGDAIPCGMDFPGNPLKVRFDRSVLEINRHIALEGTGHHWMGGYGDLSRELEIYCCLRGVRYICFDQSGRA